MSSHKNTGPLTYYSSLETHQCHVHLPAPWGKCRIPHFLHSVVQNAQLTFTFTHYSQHFPSTPLQLAVSRLSMQLCVLDESVCAGYLNRSLLPVQSGTGLYIMYDLMYVYFIRRRQADVHSSSQYTPSNSQSKALSKMDFSLAIHPRCSIDPRETLSLRFFPLNRDVTDKFLPFFFPEDCHRSTSRSGVM